MNLSAAGQPLSYEIAFLAAGLDAAQLPDPSVGNAVVEMIDKTQALAIIVLLARGDSDGFYHNLIRSAIWRRRFLGRLSEAGIDDAYHQCAGRIQGLYGALAARDFSLAEDIVGLTPVEFRPTMEYEDDYCYARLVHHLVVDSLSADQQSDLLQRYAAADDEEAPRIAVLQALLQRDGEAFGEAFSDLVAARTDAIAADRKRGQLEDAEVIAHRHVYVEGLALLSLSERCGLRIADEYAYCPREARVPMKRPFPGE